MSKQPDIDKAYVSPFDIFLRTFDAKHAPSSSQQLEKAKHDKIFKLRDKTTAKD
ncbi:MAG: hypothetical protein K0U37_02565 [Gammaproteobacteria bacterium]|nr:hypothetical protein [Gammaproteobacteria bacterium]